MGVAFFVGLSVLGVRYALLLAVVAAGAEILPIIGPWIGTAPAVLLALTQSVPLALLVLVFGVAVQLCEANVLLPRILGHAVGVPPLVVFLSILVGAELLGLVGALLAVPITAAVAVVVQDLQTSPTGLHGLPPSAEAARSAA
jgi:predicted PurR-regulated permease PerM